MKRWVCIRWFMLFLSVFISQYSFAENNEFKLADFLNLFKTSNSFTSKYPNLLLATDVPYFHRDYVVNVFYAVPRSTLQARHNDSVLSCAEGIGLKGFRNRTKLTDKAVLFQTTDKEKLLALEEELLLAKYEMYDRGDNHNFFIKKYKKGKSYVNIILYSLKNRVEMGSCYRVYFYYE